MGTELTLSSDVPFEYVLMQMAETYRMKGENYGSERDPFQNVRDIAYNTGLTPLRSCEVLLGKHHAAIKQWQNRVPVQVLPIAHTNTSDDAYLDRAVYAVIAKVLYDEEMERDAPGNSR
jgi:hypothetical protein